MNDHWDTITIVEKQAIEQKLASIVENESNSWYHQTIRNLLNRINIYGYAKYDKEFGDDKICQCGHPYYRHFDTYDNMSPIGCKYCECGHWHSGLQPTFSS